MSWCCLRTNRLSMSKCLNLSSYPESVSGHIRQMCISIYLIAGLVACNVVGQRYITLRDEHFVGPDQRLEAALERRRQVGADLELDEPPPRATPVVAPSRRSNNNNDKSKIRITAKDQVLYLIKFIIYSIQQRIEDLDAVTLKYREDDRSRIGYIFCKLGLWQTRMVGILSQLRSNVTSSTYEHFLYYQHILATNIDITYTIEFLIHLQNAIATTARTTGKNKQTGNNTGAPMNEDEQEDISELLENEEFKKEMEKYKGKELTEEEIQELNMKYELYMYTKTTRSR